MCDALTTSPAFRAVITDRTRAYRSAIRSSASAARSTKGEFASCRFVDEVPVDGRGYKVCELLADVADFVLVLRPCVRLDDAREYFLSHGYERDNLFFVFVYDRVEGEMSLLAYVEATTLPFRPRSNFEIANVESYYVERRTAYYRKLFASE